jgi:hypothetical protein
MRCAIFHDLRQSRLRNTMNLGEFLPLLMLTTPDVPFPSLNAINGACRNMGLSWKELTCCDDVRDRKTGFGGLTDVAPVNVPVLVQTQPIFTCVYINYCEYIKQNTALGKTGWKWKIMGTWNPLLSKPTFTIIFCIQWKRKDRPLYYAIKGKR